MELNMSGLVFCFKYWNIIPGNQISGKRSRLKGSEYVLGVDVSCLPRCIAHVRSLCVCVSFWHCFCLASYHHLPKCNLANLLLPSDSPSAPPRPTLAGNLISLLSYLHLLPHTPLSRYPHLLHFPLMCPLSHEGTPPRLSLLSRSLFSLPKGNGGM